MSKKNNNFTRQGVRNLDNIKAKPRGIMLNDVPDAQRAFSCTHANKEYDSLYEVVTCKDCNCCFEKNGNIIF